MLRTRVIPSLLLSKSGLVKTIRFRNPTYVGDPINAIRIFNEKEVDELLVLDIHASRERRGPDVELVRSLASECFMPLAYGGGIRDMNDIRALLNAGVEKIVLNTVAQTSPDLIGVAAREIGSQSVVVSIDAKRKFFGGHAVVSASGVPVAVANPVEFAKRVEAAGAGEIILNSIDQDGSMQGFDIPLVRSVADAVGVPVVACGGASSIAHFREAVVEGHASAVAAGSMFVFYGKHRAVLINYPPRHELESALP